MILRLAPFAPFLAATALRAITAIPCGETARSNGVGGSGGSGAVASGVAVATTGSEGGSRFDQPPSAADEPAEAEQPRVLLTQP